MKPRHTYEVVVGNVGSVYCGHFKREAVSVFLYYVNASKKHFGSRSYGESVVLFTDSEIEREHVGTQVD